MTALISTLILLVFALCMFVYSKHEAKKDNDILASCQ